MRPHLLSPLFRPISSLEGVGPKIASLFARLFGKAEGSEATVLDLLFHLPIGLIDRSSQPGIALAAEGAIVTLKVRVDRHQPSRRGTSRVPYRVFVHDDTGELALVYFHANRTHLERTLPVGAWVYVSGQVAWFNGRPQMVHPDYVVGGSDLDSLPLIEPVYPMTAGLARKTLLKAVATALGSVPALPEWIAPGRLHAAGWPSFAAALTRAHNPNAVGDLDPRSPHRARLAYDELFADQLTLALTRSHMRRSAGRPRTGDGLLVSAVRSALPFALTASQETAFAEIDADLARPQRMLRLLQGDVGSGKTVVALLAMVRVAESGAQSALMAPTELLARQHAATIRPIAEAVGLRVAILTGREKGRERAAILEALAGSRAEATVAGVLAPLGGEGQGEGGGPIDMAASELSYPAPRADLLAVGSGGGSPSGRTRDEAAQHDLPGLATKPAPGIDILIGTHALFQEAVRFRDLGLAVVDEQHRFGVNQRLALAAKGEAADVLVMTATPIPRSLVLTYFGDMDVSQLREKPAGRRPVETRIVSATRMDEVVARIGTAAADGGKVFWVCPLVEESEASEAAAAEERAAALRKALGRQVGLVHGRMAPAEKDAAMAAFRAGETRVLVATTVIEVGVDIPDATIMVIEEADRFGLAQLHQLRGRIGRGERQAICLLLYKPPLGPTARRRLEVMRETDDGFVIAEEDLRLRGEGEILGTRQAGAPGFRFADIALHRDLLEAARDDARTAVEADPDLTGPHSEAIRNLLYLFGREAAVRLLRAG